MNKMASSKSLCLFGGLVIFFAISYWASFVVPMVNDEAYMHFLLACQSHPELFLGNTSVIGCDNRLDLLTPLGVTLHRALFYVGATPSVLYATFFYLYAHPFSLYFFGFVWMALFAFLLSRETTNPNKNIGIILSFFPLVFLFIHDTGPIKYTCTMFPLGALIFRKAMTSETAKGIFWSTLLALLLFIGTEEKVFFLYFLPALGFFYLAFAERSGEKLYLSPRSILRITYIATLFGYLVSLLLFSHTTEGSTYFSHLNEITNNPNIVAKSFTTFGERLFSYIFYWPSYTHIVYDVNEEIVNNITPFFAFCGVVGLFLGFLMIASAYAIKKNQIKLSRRTLFLVLSFLSMLTTFGLIGSVWAGHHYIFLWIPLLVLFTDFLAVCTPRHRSLFTFFFFFINVVTLVISIQLPLLHTSSPERDEITNYFATQERSSQAIVTYIQGGHNLIMSLYGPKDLIVFSIQTKKDTQKLVDISQQHHRKIYIACSHMMGKISAIIGDRCKPDVLEQMMKDETNQNFIMEAKLPHLKTWQLFEALPQTEK